MTGCFILRSATSLVPRAQSCSCGCVPGSRCRAGRQYVRCASFPPRCTHCVSTPSPGPRQQMPELLAGGCPIDQRSLKSRHAVVRVPGRRVRRRHILSHARQHGELAWCASARRGVTMFAMFVRIPTLLSSTPFSGVLATGEAKNERVRRNEIPLSSSRPRPPLAPFMHLWHLLAVACVAADHVAPSAGALPTASRKKSGGKRRAAIGLGVGFAVVPRRAQELYSQYKPRTAEAWRKRMIQRRAIIPLEERAPSIFAVAFTCSVLMVRPHTLELECCAPQLQPHGESEHPTPDPRLAPADRAAPGVRRRTTLY
eukprot:scaffold47379_cov67-Phaeocystis_antarctica.AAC.2